MRERDAPTWLDFEAAMLHGERIVEPLTPTTTSPLHHQRKQLENDNESTRQRQRRRRR
jgi:hypothetical protein